MGNIRTSGGVGRGWERERVGEGEGGGERERVGEREGGRKGRR